MRSSRDAPPDGLLGIDATLRLAARVPGLHAIGAADPEHFRRVEADLAAGKVCALKAYLGYVHHGPDGWPLAPMTAYRDFIRSIIPEGLRDAVCRDNARALVPGLRVGPRLARWRRDRIASSAITLPETSHHGSRIEFQAPPDLLGAGGRPRAALRQPGPAGRPQPPARGVDRPRCLRRLDDRRPRRPPQDHRPRPDATVRLPLGQ
ncbi:MAG TPA: hypothetical protein VF590_04365 [Isosphaeraceae bacterium]